MNLYKRIFPYILATMPVTFPSCASTKAFQAKGVVKEILNDSYYCDIDNDGLVDFKFRIADFNPCKKAMFTDYIQVGDTLSLQLPNWIFDEAKVIIFDIDSVNNRTYQDLLRLNKLDEIRSEIGQPKQR